MAAGASSSADGDAVPIAVDESTDGTSPPLNAPEAQPSVSRTVTST